MIKHLTLAIILLSTLLLPRVCMAQGAGQWIRVAPSGEQFGVEMPRNPDISKQTGKYGSLEVGGQLYTVVEGDVTYWLWSFKNNGNKPQAGDEDNYLERQRYLDDCAEMVWESLLESERAKVPQSPGVHSYMAYRIDIRSGEFPGREYSIRLGKTSAVTNIYAAGERIYVLVVLNPSLDGTGARRFIQSFTTVKDGAPNVMSDAGDSANPSSPLNSAGGEGYGPGKGNSAWDNVKGVSAPDAPTTLTDDNRVFTTREVTQKARIIARPEPAYTESARKYSVIGSVVLRGVISSTGAMTGIQIVKGLPHGLTDAAVEAAKRIKCLPAIKDGRPVAQYIQIEYNFNLY
jgi:TonB family protein